MRRREFITLLGGAAAWPLVAHAQQLGPPRRIAVLMPHAETDPEGQLRIHALRTGLRKLGWIEGRTVDIAYRWGVGGAEPLRLAAAEIVASAPDVIVVFGTPGLAALKQATQERPIVFAQVSDPVSNGFVASAPRPGRNITGFSDYEYSFAVKWVELLKEIAPSVTRAAVVYGPGNLGAKFMAQLAARAPAFGIKARGEVVQSKNDVERAVAAIADDRSAGLVVLAGSETLRLRDHIIAEAARARLPATYPYRAFTVSGGLVSYGADIPAMYQGAASYVDRILRGAKPSELPIQFASKFDFVVNLRTAKAMGLTVPTSVLLRADEVIE